MQITTVCINGDDAEADWPWVGLRLLTDREWEQGARGLDGRTSPWRDAWHEGHETTWCVGPYPMGWCPWGRSPLVGHGLAWCAEVYAPAASARAPQGVMTLPPSRLATRGAL